MTSVCGSWERAGWPEPAERQFVERDLSFSQKHGEVCNRKFEEAKRIN